MRLGSLALSVSLLALAGGLSGCALLEIPLGPRQATLAATAPTVTAYRRLTESQYRHAVADVFGPQVQLNARFEPERREERLQAVGAARLSMTTSGLEQYYAMARSIADQTLEGNRRDAMVGCTPAGTDDAACAETFIQAKGQQLFRRPLTAGEVTEFKAMWEAGAKESADFHKGLKSALVGMLMSPEFLFRVERSEADPDRRGARRLDGYTKAARISYLLWDAAPDAELLESARSGEIHSPEGLQRQVDRLLASPRLEDGVKALFTDILQLEYFDTLNKDATRYPKFSQSVATSAREETLRFVVDHLVKRQGDYRDLLTSGETTIDRTLAYVYNVPFLSTEPWAPYSFPAESDRSGLLTQVTFLALFAHPGSSSPTVRGVKLQEIFRCLEVPQPPPDVDFSKVQAIEHGTVRVRLTEHMTNEGCAGCHQMTDPMGLAMERFDGLGQARTMENGALIDVVSEVEGKRVAGARGVGQFLREDPEVPACFVRNLHYYGVGRLFDPAEQPYLARHLRAFETGGYRLPVLYRSILTDPEFYKVVPPAREPAQLASLTGRNSQEVSP